MSHSNVTAPTYAGFASLEPPTMPRTIDDSSACPIDSRYQASACDRAQLEEGALRHVDLTSGGASTRLHRLGAQLSAGDQVA